MGTYILNNPSECVPEFLSSFAKIHRGILKLPGHNVILRSDLSRISGKVALLSGGGSGHEPAHAGYVGHGMLTGAICGAIFASPPPVSIMAAIRAVNQFKPKSIILIVKDYTGDRLNFGLAKTWAQLEGIKVDMIIVGDDCAQLNEIDLAHPRGLAGVLLIHKIGGAMSEQGRESQEIVDTLREIVKSMRTIGVCTKQNLLPGQSKPNFPLADGDMSVGMGIHGEAGVFSKPIETSVETARVLLNKIQGPSKDFLKLKDITVLLVNNIGGTSDLEMGVFTNDVMTELNKLEIVPLRSYVGRYLTSMQMIGLSITLLKLTEKNQDYILSLLDQPSEVAHPLISVRGMAEAVDPSSIESVSDQKETLLRGPELLADQADLMRKCVIRASEVLLQEESKLNDYDSIGGDGDCGTTHTRGAKSILDLDLVNLTKYPASFFKEVSHVCSRDMGGSSGAIYSIFLMKFASILIQSESFEDSWIPAFREGLESVQEHTGTKTGDRTLVDVLATVSSFLGASPQFSMADLKKLCDRAVFDTISMRAKAGRASYVDQNLLKNPDPGAYAVASIIKTCCKVIMANTK